MLSIDFQECSRILRSITKRLLCFGICPRRDLQTSNSDHKIRDGLYQSIVSLAILSPLVHNGLCFTFSTILHSQLNITKYQNACIASLVMMGALFGALAMGPVSDKIGRKRTSILATVLVAATWATLVSLPDNFDISLLYIIRLISGFAISLGMVAIVYVSEVTNKHWRPFFLGLATFMMSFGVPISAVVGTMMPWRSYTLVIFVIALFNIIILIPLPESPHWLLHTNPERAKNVLMKLNKNEEDFNEEWKAMETRRLSQECNLHQDVHLMSRDIRRPMLCLAMLFIFQQFGGVYIITTYALEILHNITQSTSPVRPSTETPVNASLSYPNPAEKHRFLLGDLDTLCFIGVSVIRAVMAAFTAILSKFIDNKHILVWSSAGGALCAFSFALVFSGVFGAVTDLIPLAFLFLFQLFETCGLQPIPWSQIGQLIPVSYRAKGGGIIIAYSNFLTFIAFLGFPYAMDLFGLSYIFFFYGIVASVASVFVYFFVPETRGKTFAEIEECFKTHRLMNKSCI